MRTVAKFSQPLEAELAKNRLEARGVRAYLMNEETVGLWNLGGAFGGIQLQVPEDQFLQALEVLESDPVEAEAPAVPGAASVPESRTCPQCGTAIRADMRACPECGSEATEPGYAAFLTPATEAQQEEIKEDEPESEPSPGDALAARALRAAIVGILILPPFITFYSIWLLLRLVA
jgi:hypothetical protein